MPSIWDAVALLTGGLRGREQSLQDAYAKGLEAHRQQLAEREMANAEQATRFNQRMATDANARDEARALWETGSPDDPNSRAGQLLTVEQMQADRARDRNAVPIRMALATALGSDTIPNPPAKLKYQSPEQPPLMTQPAVQPQLAAPPKAKSQLRKESAPLQNVDKHFGEKIAQVKDPTELAALLSEYGETEDGRFVMELGPNGETKVQFMQYTQQDRANLKQTEAQIASSWQTIMQDDQLFGLKVEKMNLDNAATEIGNRIQELEAQFLDQTLDSRVADRLRQTLEALKRFKVFVEENKYLPQMTLERLLQARLTTKGLRQDVEVIKPAQLRNETRRTNAQVADTESAIANRNFQQKRVTLEDQREDELQRIKMEVEAGKNLRDETKQVNKQIADSVIHAQGVLSAGASFLYNAELNAAMGQTTNARPVNTAMIDAEMALVQRMPNGPERTMLLERLAALRDEIYNYWTQQEE